MRRTYLFAFLLAAVLAVASCSSTAPTETTQPTPSPTPFVAVQTVAWEYGKWDDTEDDLLIDLPTDWRFIDKSEDKLNLEIDLLGAAEPVKTMCTIRRTMLTDLPSNLDGIRDLAEGVPETFGNPTFWDSEVDGTPAEFGTVIHKPTADRLIMVRFADRQFTWSVTCHAEEDDTEQQQLCDSIVESLRFNR